jgi:putative transposase
VRAYAVAHPAVRHRELAWRMVDEDITSLIPSTVDRILRENSWFLRGNGAPSGNAGQKASRPD